MQIILEIIFLFFPTLGKITVGGFVNQLIKNCGLNMSKIETSDYLLQVKSN